MGNNPEINKKIQVEVENLSKTFPGGIRAVDEVSFRVYEGEIFGFLGPNGAGKSTIMMILTTLLKPSSGKAFINGINVSANPQQVRMNIGYVSQELSVDDMLTGRENLWLQGGFYGIPAEERKARIAEVLHLVGLEERKNSKVETYSGGMKKRLDIAAGLLHRPRILFLDEPTLGLDIQTRSEIWRYISGLRQKEGMTIFLTTHYMEEADRICDRIGIIDHGRLLTVESPSNLKKEMGGDLIRFTLNSEMGDAQTERALERLRSIPAIRKIVEVDGGKGEYSALTASGEETLPLFFAALQETGSSVGRVTLKTPSLDDVFLSYTGRDLREEKVHKDQGLQERFTRRRLQS